MYFLQFAYYLKIVAFLCDYQPKGFFIKCFKTANFEIECRI